MIETETRAEFEAVMVELVPEILAANTQAGSGRVSVDFSARRAFAVA